MERWYIDGAVIGVTVRPSLNVTSLLLIAYRNGSIGARHPGQRSAMDEPAFDVEGLFDEDYLYFYEPVLSDDRSEAEAELIWRLLDLQPGMRVLDLACGHGRIANRLAERGCQVTGLDATPLFLERARRDAAHRNVTVDYVAGDMRSLPWSQRFDRVINWFTAYGYFDDAGNRQVLAGIAEALVPGGVVGFDLMHRDWLILRIPAGPG